MRIIVITEVCAGGHWIALCTAIKELKFSHPKIIVDLVAYHPTPKKEDLVLFDSALFCNRSILQPPFHIWRQLFSDTQSIVGEIKKINRDECVVLTTTPLGAYASLHFRLPVFYWFHGWRSCYLVGSTHKNWKESVLFLWEKISMQLSKKILVPTKETKKLLRVVLGKKAKIQIVDNMVRSEFAKPTSLKEMSAIRQKLHIGTQSKIITYVGRIAPHKGIETLIDAYIFNANERKNTVLVIAFPEFPIDSAVYEYIQKKIEDSPVSSIVLARRLNTNELRALYKVASAVILPSLYENSPLVMWECMNVGGLFIGSTAGDMGEVLGYIDKRLCIDTITVDTVLKKIQWILSLTKKEQNVLRDCLQKRALQRARKESAGGLYASITKP